MNTQATASTFHAPGSEGSFMAQHSPGPGGVVKNWKRGDVGPDGRVFVAKVKGCINGEYWATPEQFIKAEKLRRIRDARISAGLAEAKKRGFTKGFRRADGLIFWGYSPSCKNFEYWVTEAEFARKREVCNRASKAWYDKTPDAARKANVRGTARYAADPRVRSRIAAYNRAYHGRPDVRQKQNELLRQRRRNDPFLVTMERIRRRMGRVVRAGLLDHKTLRKDERDGVRFLMWLAERSRIRGHLRAFHIDHIIPFARWRDAPRDYQPNAPENIQWLPAKCNLSKNDKLPSPEEIQAHLLLVAEWRKSLIEQKQVVPENKIATL